MASVEISRVSVTKQQEEKEIFHIRFYYIKSEDSVNAYVVDQLPEHIISVCNIQLSKDSENAYGEYNVTSKQAFETKRPECIEEDVRKTWFSNKPSTEQMAWMVISRKKRSYPDFSKSAQEISFSGVKVIGGSMTSPVTFVCHWELAKLIDELKVSFQFETKRMIIAKECKLETGNGTGFTLESSFDSLHENIIVHKTDRTLVILLNMKWNPKIYKNNGKTKKLDRGTAQDTGFDNIGCLSTYCLQFDVDNEELHSEIELFLTRLICCGFHITYAELQTKLPEPYFDISLPNKFDLEYAWKCVHSLGSKVVDHLTYEVKNQIECLSQKTELLTQLLHNLAVNVIEKPFFNFKDELDLLMAKSPITVENEVPSHFYMVGRMILTPTKTVFLPKEPVFQNRILREYGPDFFIRVVYRDEDFDKMNTVQSCLLDNVLKIMKQFLKDGFRIGNRHYEFLGCSNSQLREHSFWFFHPHDDITSESIRNNSGEFSKDRCVASYVSRFGLCFSSTRRTVDVDENCLIYDDDVKKDEYCFTDGIGRISTKLAKKVAAELHISPIPSAFQIRFGGCKGVVAQDPTLGDDADVLVIRKSMIKFESKSNNLEILGETRPGRLHLNRQVITLLSGLGIPDEVFLGLQEKMLLDIADMLLYDKVALLALSESTGITDFKTILGERISFIQEPFFRSLLHLIYRYKLTNLMKRTRIQIPVDKGRIMMGTTDETKTLNPGQVFIQYSKQTQKPGKYTIIHEGPVVVTKNPCFHEGDIRVFHAINEPRLRHMVDSIVFPQKGLRPHPDEMSGSDLDGDMYFVCWDQDLCKFQNQRPMDFPKAEKKQLPREVSSHDIIDFLADYIRYDKLGLIANAHLVHADSNENGIFSEECHRLAKMHSDAVDFPKTGKNPVIDGDLRPKSYPDFMMKHDKQMYSSTKIIGKLFRQCKSFIRLQNQSRRKTFVNYDFILPSIENRMIEDAKREREQYVKKVDTLLDLYGIESENEAITGLIMSVKSVTGRLKDEKFQVGQIVKEQMCMIQNSTREIFFEEFGGETNVVKDDQRVIHKASAWYKVTYENENKAIRQILSFPWVVADVLALIKKKSTHESYSSRITDSLNRLYDTSKAENEDKVYFLQLLQVNVKTLLGNVLYNNADLKPIGLGFCGILKNHASLLLSTSEIQLEIITKAMTKHGIVKIDNKFQSQILCYRVMSDENGSVGFVTDSRIINLSKTMEQYLSKRFELKPIVQFLLDILQDTFPKDTCSYIFSDLIIAVIVYHGQSFCQNSKSILLGVLRHFINCFRSWNLSHFSTLREGWDALCIASNTLSKISEKMMLIYQKIAVEQCEGIVFFSQAVQRVGDGDKDVFYCHEVFNMAPSMFGSIKFAETYIKHQFKKRTGADVAFTQLNPIQLEAFGTDAQLCRVENIVEQFSKTSSAVLSGAERGHIIVENAYSAFFQGGYGDSRISFEIYNGIYQERHKKRHRYIPKLKRTGTCIDGNFNDAFNEKFIQQWKVLNNEYNNIFHGDICMSISLGTFYVMNIQGRKSLDVTEFNKLLTTVEERKPQPNNTKRSNVHIPYIFSFQPVSYANKNIRSILERLGFSSNDERRKTVTVKFKETNPVVCKFLENGDFICMELPDIKWLMANVIPTAPRGLTQFTHIRYKLQTLRKIDRDFASRLEGYKILGKKRKFLTITEDGYLFDESLMKSKIVSFAKDKEIETYCSCDNNTCKVEVATVRELELIPQTMELVPKTDPRTEVTIFPRIPSLKASEDELKAYARDILETGLKLATELEKSISSAES